MAKMDQATLELLLASVDESKLDKEQLEKITAVKKDVAEAKVEQERIAKRKELQSKVESNLDTLKDIVKGFDIPNAIVKIERVWNLDMETLHWKTDDLTVALIGVPASEEMQRFVKSADDFIKTKSAAVQKAFYEHVSTVVPAERIAEIGQQYDALDAIDVVSDGLGLAVADKFLTDVDDAVVKNEAKGIVRATYDKKSATDTKWTFSAFFGKSSSRKSSSNGKRVSVSTVSDFKTNTEYLKSLAYGTDAPYYDEKLTQKIDDSIDYNAKQWIEKIEKLMENPEDQLYRLAKEKKESEAKAE